MDGLLYFFLRKPGVRGACRAPKSLGKDSDRREGVAFAVRCRLASEMSGGVMERGERMECSGNGMEVAPNAMELAANELARGTWV